jgi:hypothetical protein
MTHNTTRNPHKGLWCVKIGEGLMYRSSYVVDYKALIGL